MIVCKKMYTSSLHNLRYFSNKNKAKNAKLFHGNKLSKFQFKHKETSFEINESQHLFCRRENQLHSPFASPFKKNLEDTVLKTFFSLFIYVRSTEEAYHHSCWDLGQHL